MADFLRLTLFLLGGLARVKSQDVNAAVDNSDLSFTTVGNWSVQTGIATKDGVDCLTGSAETGGQASELRTAVNGPGWLVFWRNANSFNVPSLLVDGVSARTFNSYDWMQEAVQLEAGTHQIVWLVPPGGNLRLDVVAMVTDLARPLDVALPGWTWTTGGEVLWTAVIAPAGTVTGRAQVQLPYSSTTRTGWVETSIVGPGRLSWNHWTSGGGSVEVLVDGVFQSSRSSGGTGVLPPGMHTVRWQMKRTAGASGNTWTGYLEDVRFTPGVARPLAEVLDSPNLTWTSGGDAPWDGVIIPGQPKEHAAFSGIIQQGQVSWLETTVTGPGLLQTSGSEPGWGNQTQLTVDGFVALTAFDYGAIAGIGPGTHQVRWTLAPNAPPSPYGTFARVRFDSVVWTPQAEVPLAAALEAEGLTFSASSAQDVTGLEHANGSPDDGVYLRVGGTLTATVTGPAELQWTKSGGDLAFRLDGLELITDNLPLAGDYRVNVEIPPGPHQIAWTAKPGLPCWMYSVTHTPAALLSPEAALGSASLTWQTSPEVSFFSSSAGGGLACLFLPQAPVTPQLYGLETTVTGPGLISLRTKMRASGKSRLLLDGVPYAIESWHWLPTDFCVPPGPHTITIAPPAPTVAGTVAAPAFLLVDEASWQQQQSTPLAEALDAPDLTFTTGGGAWLGVSANGTDFARAANLLSNQSAWIETTVTGPGLLSFELSQTGDVYSPKFLLDGAAKSVNVNAPGYIYRLNSFDVPAGAHTLRWSVSQPDLYSTWLPTAGQSAVLDAVSWQPFNPQPITAWAGGAGFSLTASAHDWQSVTGPDRDGGGSLHPLTVTPGDPAWLEATATGPAALEFSIYAAGENRSSTVTVTLDGARNLNAVLPDFLTGTTGWTEHLLFIPDGPHTVRWTLPADRPLIWLDQFRLTPASSDFSAAVELPGATWTLTGERQWCVVSRPDLPDGDAIAVESGFYWDEYLYPEDSLAFSVSGPGRLTLRARSAQRPAIVVDDIFSATPAAWSAEPNGWSAATFNLPPGTHRLAVSPQGDGPLLLDRADWTPLPGPSLGDVFPLPGVTWSTSPEYPFHAFADPGLIAQPSAMLALAPDAPGGWIEAALTGPGTFSFSVQVFGDYQFFRVLVDGQPVAAVDESADYCESISLDFMAGFSTASQRYSLALSPGAHTIRWAVPDGMSSNYAKLLVLHSMTLTAASAFTAVSPNDALLFLHGETASPQALADADGTPFVRVPSGGPDQSGNDCTRMLLGTRTTAPGFFKFRYRSAPGNWEQDAACYVVLWHPESNEDFGSNLLTSTTAWREVELFVPDRSVMVQWALPGNVAGLDLSAFTFTPVSPVPLDVALGIPGTLMTTNPDRPWKGWRSPDGSTFVTPSSGGMHAFPRPWMEATVSGPALLSWNYWLEPGQWPFWEEMDGQFNPADSLSRWPIPYPLSAWELVIPAGAHQVLWAMPQMPPGSRTGIERMSIKPLPLSYAAWRPPLPWGDPWNRPGPPGPSADYDFDGLTNLEEFTWQTDPFASTLPPQPLSSIAAGHLTVCVPAPRPLSDGVQVYFESSADLHHWQRAATELLPAPPAGQMKYRLTDPVSSSPRLYLRPRVEFVE